MTGSDASGGAENARPPRRSPTDLLSIGEIARRAGIATSAVRFYEERGLIDSVRTAGNQRRYARHTLRRIGIIVAATRFGISLAEVGEVFESLPHDRMPSKADWRRISRGWHERLEARRRELERLESELAGCIGCGCLSLSTCRVLNPGDVLSAEGAGARRLVDTDVATDVATGVTTDVATDVATAPEGAT